MIASRFARSGGAALVLAACSAAPIAPGSPKIVPGVALAPYAALEECVDLVPGDRLEYRFESSEPVAFDIRYRDAGLTVAPITRGRVVEDSGVYAPTVARAYCLAWEAGAAGAVLAYRASLRRGTR